MEENELDHRFQHLNNIFQLRLPIELYSVGSMGDRVRDGRREHPPDHPAEQVALSGLARRRQRRIVSSKMR